MEHHYSHQWQNEHVSVRVVAALDRLGEFLQAELRQHAHHLLASPLHVKLLAHLVWVGPSTASALAEHFAITKPTISDSVRDLTTRGFVQKVPNATDKRSTMLHATDAGQTYIAAAPAWSTMLTAVVDALPAGAAPQLLHTLLHTLHALQQGGAIAAHRMCLCCGHYNTAQPVPMCLLLQKPLHPHDLRLNCPEHVATVAFEAASVAPKAAQ
jgi:DNA-binding MarR family transcriptional regulator